MPSKTSKSNKPIKPIKPKKPMKSMKKTTKPQVITKKEWLKLANHQYNSVYEIIHNYTDMIKHNKVLKKIEQHWVDKNLQVIIDFMGDEEVWAFMLPDVVVHGTGKQKRASSRIIPPGNTSIAVYSGSHWRSRKSSTSKWFDPYDDYQIKGTNQFCQTFAMMNLLDYLPTLISTKSVAKYYSYTLYALEFINHVISIFPDSTLHEKSAIKECMKYPNICLNSIEIPRH